MTEHKKIHRTCPECLLAFSTVKDMHAHVKKVHGESVLTDFLFQFGGSHLCVDCGRIFPTASFLAVHRAKSHRKSSGEAKCETCGKVFKDKERLKQHRSTHLNVRKKVCQTCGKTFKNAGNLFQHKQQHLPRKHVCSCGHAFTYKHGLKNHQERCFAGLPCKRPHTKNRPQKDNFGQIIPPVIVNENQDSNDQNSAQRRAVEQALVPPAFLPPAPQPFSANPLVFNPQVFGPPNLFPQFPQFPPQ